MWLGNAMNVDYNSQCGVQDCLEYFTKTIIFEAKLSAIAPELESERLQATERVL